MSRRRAARGLAPGWLADMSQGGRAPLGRVDAVLGRRDLTTLAEVATSGLGLKDIGAVRVTGAFIVIDILTNETVGAGMVIGAAEEKTQRRSERVSAQERAQRLGQFGAVVWLSASALDAAYALERRLFDGGLVASVVVEPTATTALALREAGVIALVVSDAQAVDGAVVFEGDVERAARALEACRWGEG